MIHDRNRSVVEALDRVIRYAPAEAQAMIDRGEVFTARRMFATLGGKARKQFIHGEPWLDGVPGFMRAGVLVAFHFYVWACFWELSGAPKTPEDDAYVLRLTSAPPGPAEHSARRIRKPLCSCRVAARSSPMSRLPGGCRERVPRRVGCTSSIPGSNSPTATSASTKAGHAPSVCLLPGGHRRGPAPSATHRNRLPGLLRGRRRRDRAVPPRVRGHRSWPLRRYRRRRLRDREQLREPRSQPRLPRTLRRRRFRTRSTPGAASTPPTPTPGPIRRRPSTRSSLVKTSMTAIIQAPVHRRDRCPLDRHRRQRLLGLGGASRCVQPRIVVIETHTEHRLEDVCAPYRPDFDWRRVEPGELVGASPAAMRRLGLQLGYRLVGGNRFGFNAFFVRDDLAADLLPAIEVEELLHHDWNREPSDSTPKRTG